MPKTNPLPRLSVAVLPFLLLATLLVALASPCSARRPTFHWTKIRVIHAPPSEVFSRLGLTHSTRYGFAKDGYKKSDPDPTFPAGLTDVVPYNADGLLLVRGTEEGLAQFRRRVADADAALQRWQVKAELFPLNDPQNDKNQTSDLGAPLAMQTQEVVGDTALNIAFSDIRDAHPYQLTVLGAANGAMTVECRCSLSLPAKPSAPVFAPPMVWSAPMSQPARSGVAALFFDKAADRRAAQSRLGIASDPSGSDYQVRVTITAVS